jgi:ribosomal protein S12 methylthiotransferase
VEGATANQLPDPVPEALKEERRARFMELQAAISARRLESRVGREMTVLVDSVDRRQAVARSAADAPEIDGVVLVSPPTGLKVGEFARVRITGSDTYDLQAVPVA